MVLSVWLVLSSALGSFSLPAVAAEQVCKECHEDKYTAPVGHYPSQEGLCEVCHTVEKRHFEDMDPKAVTTQKSAQACYQCHEQKDQAKHVHPALQMSEDSCISCHNPHGGQHPTLLKQKLPTLCMDCHDSDSFTKGKSVHKITSAGKSCARCHDSHSSSLPKMLTQKTEDICFSCHNREVKTAERVIPNIKEKIEKSMSVHMVATECSECHSPHASQFDRLLSKQFSISDYTRYVHGDDTTANTYELCFKCHDKGMMNRTIDADSTRFRKDSRNGVMLNRVNLHWVHVTNATGTTGPDRGRSCKVCHDPHGAPQDRLIRNRMFKGNAKLEFQVIKEGDNEVGGTCAKSCHSPKSYQRID